jgi:non-heme chloroperoxidase
VIEGARRVATATLPTSVALPFVEQGDVDGVPVVFLHAYADSWRSFERVLDHLPPRIHALAPTQRGHGDASKPESGYRVEDFAGDTVAFLDWAGLAGAVLVASSSAVFTVERTAVEAPDRVLGLVLIGVPWNLESRRPSLDFLEAVAGLEDPVDREFVASFVTATTTEAVPRDLLEEMIEESKKLPAHVWRATLDGLLDARAPAVGAIRAPTLVIWGERDELVPRSDQDRLIAALPGARLLVYEGAGHIVHWEQPERVARDIVAFTAEL